MRTKNAKSITTAEHRHLDRVKELPCSLCDAAGPSEAHHINQGEHWTAVALCVPCHRGGIGWHGTKALWRVQKMDELGALNITLRRAYG